MPQQRRASPRRRDRRSRSRSRSPRRRRRSHSRSRSRDRRRSRSPQRKRSPERKLRSPPRKRSPPKKRSPSPKRHAKSRSRSPKRRARYSSSPSERGYPVKRPADSSVKRQGYRSRSASPTAQKRLRDDKPFREESRDMHRSRRTPSPSAGYGGKMYSDQPSSSKEPLFPAGSSRRKPEIDFVTIVEKGPKREKLNKRFETLEQVAQGSFDFEENITIGIHRGPQHIQLHEDEDIEVNYEFNQKTFKMLFPKKDYSSAIFDREEIRAFHHDDILDEEAYVEKRTISIKPVEKPKSRKYSDEIDYKVTVGSERDGYGDRRMVHDSGSRSRPSRSSGYNDIPVTVRLDPKPDPRYEKIYKEQQRQADQSLIQEKIQRNPNDLRYNLMRRKSDGDRGDRSRDAPKKGMMDARSRIEARRESHGDGRRDRSAPERRTPPRIDDRKRRNTKTDLPDFKNRPGVKLDKPKVWIIGSSVVKDIVKFGERFPEYNLATNLKDDVESLEVHGENDMGMENILSGVKFMMKSKELPQMIVIHCGEQNICEGRNVDCFDIMKRDLSIIRQEIPGVVLVWTQLLPPWHIDGHPAGSTLAKSRRRINRFMMQCFVNDEVNGAFLYHPCLRTDMTKYHMPTTDQCLHLNKIGMTTYLYELQAGIRYLISGHGSIFPYMKWPMKRDELEKFDPESICMLNREHILTLKPDILAWLSEQQFQSLTNEQIHMFHVKQFKFLFKEDMVCKFSQNQLKGLDKQMFYHLSENALKVFSDHSERMEYLNEEARDYIVKKLAKFESKKNVDTSEQTIGDLMNESEDTDVVDSDEESKSDDSDSDDWAKQYVGAILRSVENEMENMDVERHEDRSDRNARSGGRRSRLRSGNNDRNVDFDEFKARGITQFGREERGNRNESGRARYRSEYGRRGRHAGNRERFDDGQYRRQRRGSSESSGRIGWRDRYERKGSSERFERGGRSRERFGRAGRRSRDRFERDGSRDSSKEGSSSRSSRSSSSSCSRDRYDSDDSSERHQKNGRKYRHRSRSSSKDHQYIPQGQPPSITVPLPYCPPFHPLMPGMFPPGPPMMPRPPMMFNPGRPPMPFPMRLPGRFPPPPVRWPPASPPVQPVPSKPQEKNWGDFPSESDSCVTVNTSNLKLIGDS